MTDSNVIQFPTKEEMEKRFEGIQVIEWIFTNDKENPAPKQFLHLLYDGVFKNRVGIMHAKDKSTDEIVTIIVGVELNDEGDVACYPMARLLTKAEQDNYLAPDGNGGYLDGSD